MSTLARPEAATGVTCGTLEELHPADGPTAAPGLARIDGMIFRLSPKPATNGTNTIDSAAVVGKRACISGSADGEGLMTNYTLTGCTAYSSVPECTSSILPLGGGEWAPFALAGAALLVIVAAGRGGAGGAQRTAASAQIARYLSAHRAGMVRAASLPRSTGIRLPTGAELRALMSSTRHSFRTVSSHAARFLAKRSS